MEWTRSETLGLAQQSCTLCFGLGVREGRGGAPTPCHCVYRAIFRACLQRFQQCTTKEKYISRVTLDYTPGKDRRQSYGLKDEEYMADFALVSRRYLSGPEYDIFRFHFLLGADWKLCCRRLNMERGDFFHAVYRIQSRLGRVFRELKPYALFPLDEYFTTHRQTAQAGDPRYAVRSEGETGQKKLRFPIQRAA